MTLNPKQFYMHLYHGTSAANVEGIKAGGLGGHFGHGDTPVYLTHDPELAEYYAHDYDDPVVVKVRVHPRNLEVDWNSFDEPVYGYSEKDSRKFDPSKLRHETRDWANSLRQTGAVVHRGTIPPENVIGIS